MPDSTSIDPVEPACDFDYSAPEAQEALRQAAELVLEIRKELDYEPITRKVALYEWTLGLAVIPVLLRRAAYALWWKLKRSGAGAK